MHCFWINIFISIFGKKFLCFLFLLQYWTKLCSSDNHYTMVPPVMIKVLSFKWYLFIVSICCNYCTILLLPSNCYRSLCECVHMTVVTKTWLQHCGLEFFLPLMLYVSCKSSFTSIQFFCSEFWWLIMNVVQQTDYLLILFSLSTYIQL